MSTSSFDLLVIGAGPGGYVAANRASQLGLKVAVIERDHPGGICLNWGCIPSKALLKAAETYNTIQHAEKFGITVADVSVDFAKVVERSRGVAEQMRGGVAYLLDKYNVTLIKGTASFKDKTTLTVTADDGSSQEVVGKNIIIATGARPRAIPGVEFDGKKVLSYFNALDLRELPKSIVIIGAGAIGVEFAYFWKSFGAEVTLIEMMDQIVPLEDAEIAKELQKMFKRSTINIKTGTRVAELAKTKKGVSLQLEKNGKTEILDADIALVAIGVQANSESLNLEAVAVTTERGFINVDKTNYQTGASNIYAIGDCIATPLLAHVASAEALVCVEKIAGHDVPAVDYSVVPACTYCQPQIASVGLKESEAKEQGYTVKVGKFPFKASGKAVAIDESNGFVKLVFDAESGLVLGAHIIGVEATELIAEMVMAKNYELSYQEILKTMHAHPTLSEALLEATAVAWDVCVNL